MYHTPTPMWGCTPIWGLNLHMVNPQYGGIPLLWGISPHGDTHTPTPIWGCTPIWWVYPHIEGLPPYGGIPPYRGIPPYGCVSPCGGMPQIRGYTHMWGYTSHTWDALPYTGIPIYKTMLSALHAALLCMQHCFACSMLSTRFLCYICEFENWETPQNQITVRVAPLGP